MEKLNPWKFGAVLSLTVGISYVLCTIAWVNFTGPAIDFLNALFHGLDFRKLQMVAAAFSVAGFVYALIVLMVWAYLVGAIYALVRYWLRPEQEKPRP
jgi:cytosine/uracil/thiamine/allantoin permease